MFLMKYDWMVNIIKTVFGTLKEEENNMITTLDLKEPLILTSSTLKNAEKQKHLQNKEIYIEISS